MIQVFGLLTRGEDEFGDGFFKARRDGGNRLHMGVDLAALPGTPVVAWKQGLRVVRVARPYGDDSRFSGLLIQDGATQIKIFYIAIDQGFIGKTARQGDTLGTVQDLGARYRGITPHVHFEVWVKGVRVNPKSYLAGGCYG